MAGKKVSETKTNQEYVDYLTKIGCFVWRNNTGMLKSGGRFVRFGKLGSGDIIGLTPSGRFISIENKSNGEPISKAQHEFANSVAAKNGIAIFVKSLDDLISQIEYLKCQDYLNLPF